MLAATYILDDSGYEDGAVGRIAPPDARLPQFAGVSFVGKNAAVVAA